jgi:flagellar biosynthetic protein FliR
VVASVVDVVALTYVRFAPLILFLPIPPIRIIPVFVRANLCMLVAIVVGLADRDVSDERIGVMIISEVILGTALAMVVHVFYGAVAKFVSVIDSQAGFIASAVFDPSTGHFDSVLARIMVATLTAAFFYLELYKYVIIALSLLMTSIPLGSKIWLADSWYLQVGSIFMTVFLLFAPVILLLLVVDFFIAVVSRSIPQAQIYFVSLPVKVFLAILMMATLTQFLGPPIQQAFLSVLLIWETIMVVS